MSLGAAKAFGVGDRLSVVFLTFAASAFAYVLDRTVDPGERSSPSRRSIVLSAAVWLGSGLWAVALGHPAAALHSIAFPLSALAYARPWMDLKCWGGTVRRMKDIPLTKPLYVGGMWAQLGISAALFGGGRRWRVVVFVCAWIFAKAVVNSAGCDLDDIDEDRRRNVRTWPVVLGRSGAVRLLQFVNAACALPVLVAVGLGYLPHAYAWFELLGLQFAVALVLASKQAELEPGLTKAVFDIGAALVLVPVAMGALL